MVLPQGAQKPLTGPGFVQNGREVSPSFMLSVIFFLLLWSGLPPSLWHQAIQIYDLTVSMGHESGYRLAGSSCSRSHQTEIKASARKAVLTWGSRFSSRLLWLLAEFVFLCGYDSSPPHPFFFLIAIDMKLLSVSRGDPQSLAACPQ